MTRKKADVEAGLKAKGFEQKEGDHHVVGTAFCPRDCYGQATVVGLRPALDLTAHRQRTSPLVPH